MSHHRLFPDISFLEWVDLWKHGYSPRYGPQDDSIYLTRMANVQKAIDDATLSIALSDLFEWKDQIATRWNQQISAITFRRWCELKTNPEIPQIWDHGIVFNVFLLHALANGSRPIIDQHVWRGYCFVIDRKQKPAFPTHRATALRFYHEYESWFAAQVKQGIDKRNLDKALMAFGQFCKKQFRPMIAYFSQNHESDRIN